MINTTQIRSLKIDKRMSLFKGSNHSHASTASLSSYDTDSIDDSFHLSDTLSAISISEVKKTKRVTFGSLEVHEHAVQLGGSGCPRTGPPMTLEWEKQAYYLVKSVESFENSRPFESRRGSDLLQPSSERIAMLLEAGHTLGEIRRYTKENEIVRKQRCETFKKTQRSSVLSKVLGR